MTATYPAVADFRRMLGKVQNPATHIFKLLCK